MGKEEITKRLLILQRKITAIEEGGRRQNSIEKEDGMLTKKQLGPIMCASCEQGLVNA